MPNVIALEPSPEYAAILGALLDHGDLHVTVVDDLAQLRDCLQRQQHDAVIVSFAALPEGAGDLQGLREVTTAPIIALVNETDEVKEALHCGADYDLLKPFDPEIFLAAVEATLRRGGAAAAAPPAQTVAGLIVDAEGRTVERGGDRRSLSQMEWDLFAYLLAHPGRVLTRRQLAAGAWGAAYGDRLGQAELYISRVRRKIEERPEHPQLIETVRGRGYRFNHSS